MSIAVDDRTLVVISRRRWHTGACGITTGPRAALWIAKSTRPLCGNCRRSRNKGLNLMEEPK